MPSDEHSATADFTPPADPNGETMLPPAGSGPGTISHTPGADATADHASASAEGGAAADPGHLPDIPGYAIEAEIARGGMGVVFRARHLRLNRPAAIKMILGGRYHDPMAHIRFLVEAEAVAALDHPNVVHVHEFGTHENLPFFALEYVGGGTLADKLTRDGKPAPRAAAELVVKLTDGIAAAHAKGIVHRDLKPANVLLTEAGEPKVADFGLAKVGRSDMTATGAVMGTPSYMSPEQAAGRTKDVGTSTDIYALGAILYELLTGEPPFRGETAVRTIHLVLTQEPARPRSRDRSIPRDLETICLKCLAKEPGKRYATASDLSSDLRAYLGGRPIAARPVGNAERAWKWVKRNPGRAAAVAAAVLVAVGAVGAGFVFQQALADQRVEAETKRLDDLRAADREAAAKQRQARADGLVQALESAEPKAVPVLLKELAEYRDEVRPRVRELAARPIEERAGFHARLALLADPNTDPKDVTEVQNRLGAYVAKCRADELLLLLDFFAAFYGRRDFTPFWVPLDLHASEPKELGIHAVRWATILARLDPASAKWTVHADHITKQLVRMNPLEVEPFAEALRPVRGHLLPSLLKRYPESRARIESGKLATTELVAEASAFDLTANLLARYTLDRPTDLAELAVLADPRHYKLFSTALVMNKPAVVPLLKAELAKTLPADSSDADLEVLSKRRGHAAAAVITLGEWEAAWPLFTFPKDGDPTARSYLVQRLGAIAPDLPAPGQYPAALMSRFGEETDVSVKRALLIALGDFPPTEGQATLRDAFAGHLLTLYREHPDPGLHGAIDWLLRQKWGKAKELAAIDAELSRAARGRVAARALADAAVPVGGAPAFVGPLLPAPPVAKGKDWFVNGEGQTFAVVRGPVEFTRGSPLSEPGRIEVNEPAHRKRVGRTFAIATKEVTVAEFTREFRPAHSWPKQNSPGPDTPAVAVTWYDCAAYCNWLSAREGIPEDQWCYEPVKGGVFGEGMSMKAGHLKLTGYRLPTESEWEFACRGGAVTARYHGRGEDLLPRYGWFAKNAEDRAWPVGQLRPNELGLFDMLGNALEWCEDPGLVYATGQKDDIENSRYVLIDERSNRLLRGGSFDYQPVYLRSAGRNNNRPGNRNNTYGFRPVRTFLN